ncbi:MAG: helix-turn-helix domain-containing protein [bacterium]
MPSKTDQARNGRLGVCVEKSVKRYLKDLNGTRPSGVYQMVLGEVEKPLLAVVMNHAAHNQSEAAKMLGITRHTLRKKLAQHGLKE